MNCFQFFPHDQAQNNWLMFTEGKEPPYVSLKPRYLGCLCPKCKSIDHDKAFAEGFDQSLKIRAKGDLFGTSEGFLCISEKAKLVIESARFGGLSLKPLPKTGWWVVNVTCRVEADQGAYSMRKPICDQCGRPRATWGMICCLNQIAVPEQSGMFFSPVFDRGGSRNGDRDLFVTEDIVAHFKNQGIKGGVFSRLLTPSEYEGVKAAGAERDPLKWPKGSQIVL